MNISKLLCALPLASLAACNPTLGPSNDAYVDVDKITLSSPRTRCLYTPFKVGSEVKVMTTGEVGVLADCETTNLGTYLYVIEVSHPVDADFVKTSKVAQDDLSVVFRAP